MDTATPSESLALYTGEVLDTVAGFPTIYHYQPPADEAGAKTLGQPEQPPKPLIVCVTGGLHLARVFYGGHTGSEPHDFLAHWLSRLGFGVLSLSYPLETSPPIMPLTGAGFRVADWGRQAALTALQTMEAMALATRAVILVSWSMGGRMVVRFTQCARELGLDVQQYISFSATPGFSSIRPLPPGMACSGAGYFLVPPHVDVFCQQLEEMGALDGSSDDSRRTAVPRDVFLREYLGATPVNLIGLGLQYDAAAGRFVPDAVPHEADTQVLDVASYPLVSALFPSSILDASHALADKASWGFLLTFKLEALIGREGLAKLHGSPHRWRQVRDLVHAAPERLCVAMPGNHYFFVGEAAARRTAETVAKLVDEARALQQELASLLA